MNTEPQIPHPEFVKNYKSYKNLPTIAGLCSMEEAMKPGLSIEDCVTRLKRYHYAFHRLFEIFVSRLTSEPIYELKMAFALHGHLCAEHVGALRKRVGEMREPPLGLDKVPHPSLQIFFDEIQSAPVEELLMGIYEKALPALQKALESHVNETNKLIDHPSYRVSRFALIEVTDMIDYGKRAVPCLADDARHQKAAAWLQLLDDCLTDACGLDGAMNPNKKNVERQYSRQPFAYDGVPKRDERFPDPYNMGVHAEEFLYDEHFPAKPKTLMMYYKRIREIDVPEMMASIITETKEKQWGYYQDMTRQLWDEARHAMMGEVGFTHMGVDWKHVMVNFTWSKALNTQLKPIERHAVLYFIEQGLMPKTGKRFEWETAMEAGNYLATLIQDYDWADEVLHARIGRDWYVTQFENAQKAVAYGDECWSRVLVDWNGYKEQGLTEHRNWWPDVYGEACKQWGETPDPAVLAYSTSYESTRADLKTISGSA